MYKINKMNNSFFLENENKKYIKFLENQNKYLLEILDIKLELNRNEFKGIIKDSILKKIDLLCEVNGNSKNQIELLINLGFEFYGAEYNPDLQEMEEKYIYKNKEEIIIGDEALKEILKKLEIK